MDGWNAYLSLVFFQILRRPEYFGQYGKIVKVVANRVHNPADAKQLSASAYVTFAHKEDARAAIQAVDNIWVEGRHIR